MSTVDARIRDFGERLDRATTDKAATSPLSRAGLADETEAYLVQEAGLDLRTGRGETVIGGKLGLTSRAKQIAMGVDQPLCGFLTDGMLISAERRISLEDFVHPRVEPEIAFVLAEPLRGPGVTVRDVLRATLSVGPALDVIDSRYVDFRFSHLDAIADNASGAAFALGHEFRPPDRGLDLLGCVLDVDGQVVDSAAGAAVMGHPAAAVARMANDLAVRGAPRHLEAGWVVLSGGLTAPVPLRPRSTVTATFPGLGHVTITCTR